MAIVKFLHDMDASIAAKWQENINSQKYSEDEVRVATVLTRLDTALNTSLTGYNARTLESIKYGVWALVVIGTINLLFSLL